jgi:dTMP kinase
MTEPGKYIVIEGIDGSGKTIQSNKLAKDIDALRIREPGGGDFGMALRTIIKDPAMVRNNPITDVLLNAASRSEPVVNDIEPNITSGRHVVSDRSWYSSLAYQSAQGVDSKHIEKVNQIALGKFFRPDLFLFLNVEVEETARRIGARADYYESMGSNFMLSVAEKYREVVSFYGGIAIDASQTIEQVGIDIRREVQENLAI